MLYLIILVTEICGTLEVI